jgi:N-acetylneuraminic acid mutarotase
VYVFGGTAIGGSPAGSYKYDPAADMWSPISPLPTPRRFAAAAASNGHIYVFGGENGVGTPYADVDEYDPLTDSWTAKRAMPTGRMAAAVAVSSVGTIFVIGGAVYNAVDLVESYDPVSDSWATHSSMSLARHSAAAATIGSKIIVCGGESAWWGSTSFFDAVEEYDIVSDKWSRKSSMASDRTRHVTLALGSRLVVIGGQTGGGGPGVPADRVETYDPSADTWSVDGFSSSTRYWGCGAVVGTEVFFIAGHAPGGTTDRVEEYTLGQTWFVHRKN